MSKKTYKFKQKNLVSCVGIPFRTLVWNYICWLLAGRPKMKEKVYLFFFDVNHRDIHTFPYRIPSIHPPPMFI